MAADYTLEVDAGATFYKRITWQNSENVPYNLTGATARMHIRKRLSDTTPIIELTTENDGIRITPLTGLVEIYIDDVQTMLLPSKSVYDIEIVMPSVEVRPNVTRLLQGHIYTNKNVTREEVV